MLPSGLDVVPHVREHVEEGSVARPGRVRVVARVWRTVKDVHGDSPSERSLNMEKQVGDGLRVGRNPDSTHLVGDHSLARNVRWSAELAVCINVILPSQGFAFRCVDERDVSKLLRY